MELKKSWLSWNVLGEKNHIYVSEVIAKKKVATSPKEEKSAERSLHGLRAPCR